MTQLSLVAMARPRPTSAAPVRPSSARRNDGRRKTSPTRATAAAKA